MAPLGPGSPIGVYLHIPFCSHICPYCDFNTYRGLESLIPSYVDTLLHEIEGFSGRHGRPDVATIYFGGGTPSLLPAEAVASVIRGLRASFAVSRDAEITLEANPNSVDRGYFEALASAGINRLSVGAQTFDRKGLRVLGRQHEACEIRAAVSDARSAGFSNVSLDLIFGWPGQTLESWKRDLAAVLEPDTGPDHLSLYSLIIEPGTPFADAVRRGVMTPVSDDEAADYYELAMETLEQAGWIHYEVSNWAREPGFESRHNMLYWRNGEYAGFGAGAHWRIGDTRRMNHLLPQTWIASVERGEEPVSNTEVISPEMSMGETMMLGLRLLHEGVTVEAFAARHGAELGVVYDRELRELHELGLLNRTPDRVTLSPRGLMLANDVCSRFLR